jgi:hypothetical protein
MGAAFAAGTCAKESLYAGKPAYEGAEQCGDKRAAQGDERGFEQGALPTAGKKPYRHGEKQEKECETAKSEPLDH